MEEELKKELKVIKIMVVVTLVFSMATFAVLGITSTMKD